VDYRGLPIGIQRLASCAKQHVSEAPTCWPAGDRCVKIDMRNYAPKLAEEGLLIY